MKAWGYSKKIMRGDDVADVETFRMNEFSGGSVQRPFLRKPAAPLVQTEPEPPAPEPESSIDEPPTGDTPALATVDPAELTALRETARAEGYAAGMAAG